MPLSLPARFKPRRRPKKGAVQVWTSHKASWPQRLTGVLTVSLGLSGAIALGIGGTWLGSTLLLRPNPPAWLTRYFPQQSARWGTESPQSWAEITAELQAQGQQAGTLLALDTVSRDPNAAGLWLLPVLAAQDSDQIVALNLYGEHHQTADGPVLQPLDRITLQAPLESTVMEPLSQAGLGQLTSTQPLPLTELRSLEGTDLPGAWLTLTGDWRKSGSPIRYGQVIHIDARALTVRALMNWSSPPQQLPLWHNLDQAGLPELIVNQSVGLEPNFKAYTIEGLSSPLFSLRLAPVDLQEAAVTQDPAQGPYNTALRLARHGLWNEAQRRLASLKQQHPNHWTPAAERQHRLIALHGELTQTQAERAWSQPSQKLLSLLIDGRWQLALTFLDGEVGFQRTVLPLLRQDTTGRLWRRITATLQVNPRQPEARLWGALLLLAQQDQAKAEAWLKQNALGQQRLQQFTEIATRLNSPADAITVANRPVPINPASPASAIQPIQGWIGIATPIRGVQLNHWYADRDDLTLPEGRQWYQVQVHRGWVAGQWQSLAASPSESELWERLGPSPTLQLLNSEGVGDGTTIAIAAIQQQGNQINLLATGPLNGAGSPQLAISPRQFRRFADIARQPFTTVYQRYPDALETLGSVLGLGNLSAVPASSPGQGLTVQLQDVTGDGQAEIILSPEGKSAIVDSQGQILFQVPGGAVLLGGLVNGDGSHILVTRSGGQYRFYDWSIDRQRFE
ncbi:MAG: hypothetical protein ACFB0C_06035 [Leptolyngbyaceae cyanobacterium]